VVQAHCCVVSCLPCTRQASTCSMTYSTSITLAIRSSCSREFPSSFCGVFSSQLPFNFISTRCISRGHCFVRGNNVQLSCAYKNPVNSVASGVPMHYPLFCTVLYRNSLYALCRVKGSLICPRPFKQHRVLHVTIHQGLPCSLKHRTVDCIVLCDRTSLQSGCYFGYVCRPTKTFL